MDATRPLRKDAQRNRDRVLAAAVAAFGSAQTAPSFDGIAAAAGVGVGTVYRHFPTREALVEAVYSAELDDVTGGVDDLLERFPPDVALRAWMSRYAEFLATKRLMIDVLRAGWASGSIATPATRERINTAIGTLLEAGAHAGTLRPGVEADDVTVVLLGTLMASATVDDPERTGRLLDLIMNGLRPPQR